MKSRFMLNAAQVALVGAFGMLPSLALAQSDSGPPTTSSTRTSPSAFGLEAIIVTARKREASLQTVPLAVTAITTEQLRERQIKSPSNLPFTSPALNLPTGAATHDPPLPSLPGPA